MKATFPGSATTIFIIFFGVALLDALTGGSVWAVLFWLGAGAVFAYADLRYIRRVRADR